MALFNQFPYTDFHQMNLQFILEKVKDLDSIQEAVTDLQQKYQPMQLQVNQLADMYNSFADSMEQQFDDLTIQMTNAWDEIINQALTDMGYAFADYTSQINATVAIQTARINQMNAALQTIQTDLYDVYYVDSPFTGEKITIQQAIADLASLHMTDALTAGAYDAKDLTASYYDGLAITAYQYDWNGQTYVV